ncbi:hypothetical protein B0H10DRAFT_2432733 [Mycena sp. CBHHK59/15]|nr:hypothetical protein B0H10DRAFT_2432733 [Mycena sp. CBHHK59/15]
MGTIVVDDEKEFIADDWIRKGKDYSDDLPWEVIEAKNAVFKLPAPVVGLIPAGNVPVTEFAALALPRQSSELAYGETQLWFSNDEPTTDIGVLKDRTRTVPPQRVLDLLARKSGQAWLNGARSIADPRYNEGADRFPLWVLTYWKEMASVIGHQTHWKRSIEWLDNEQKKCKEEHTRTVVEEARAELKILGWNAPLSFGKQQTSTTYLQQFLGTVWLSTDSIDIMMEELSARVEADPELADVTVATLEFSRQILDTSKGQYTKQTASLLHRYEREVKEKRKKRIIFPVNVGNKHWVGGAVDFTKKTIEFGDSLPGFFAPPKKFIKATKRWTQLQFGEEFHSNYDGLEHGIQKDGYNCGIVMFNTCERAVYPNTPLWIPRSAVLARIQHFLKYAKNQIKEISPETSTTGAARAKISIADLLNPRKGQSNKSSNSIASSDNSEAGSSDYSDADVLLGRATWDDDSEDDGSMMEAPQADASDHLSFATTSGADFSDWDVMSGSAMEVDTGGFTEDEPEKAALEDEERPAMEVDVADAAGPSADGGKDSTSAAPGGKSEPKKGRIQSTLLGFFKGKGKTRSEDVEPKEPAPSGGKRRRAGTDASGGSAASSVPTKKKPKKERAPIAANAGLSKSAKWAREANEQVRNGTFVVDPDQYANWKGKVLGKDPYAEFFPGIPNLNRVRHSKCATIVRVKNPYDFTRFKAHVDKECPVIHGGAGMSTLSLDSFKPGGSKARVPQDSSAPPCDVDDKPCPGITEDDIPNVQKYLQRSGAMGGGSRSVFKIAMSKFSKAFGALGKKCQREVLDTQQHERKWRNDHAELRIFSSSCQKKKSFKVALKKPAKDPKNYIYTNKQYKNQLLGEIYSRTIGLQDIVEQPNAKTTPCIRYAQGALQGKYDNDVFNGLVEAMVTKVDREERGVGMQNFKYAPAYDEFCNVLRINSPAAYRSFQEHLPARSERSFRAKEAREPRFPMDISDRNFELAAGHLAALNYDGPVNLSCDDTKLFPSFRLYWDGEQKSHFLVGGTDGPLRVTDPDQVKAVIAEAKAKKATKIRLWCLTIPVPGVTPIIVAALPIANDLKADVLLKYLDQVVNGLLDHGINIISYACDGTQIERTVQDLFVKQATEHVTHIIKDPHGKRTDLCIIIAVVRGHSICMIQDSKHALKTFRNNLFSGARLLALGSYTAIYSRIREMAFADGAPLFHRDVEKLDRQDDNAATRLFSADTLKYLADHHPEYLGEIVYLFIFGELIDAYQNRSICHAERVKLVLRARYFLDSWSSFLDISNYNRSVYFLSREAVDIARFIIEGYLSLLYIHRDHLNGIFPLLPWLHSSEACEHVFGESRHIVKDFAMLDFLYMIPKLRVKLRAAVLRAKASNPKARAAGYSHTYFDTTGLDILALSTFPTDADIDEIASEAAEESDSLMALLGLAPSQLYPGAVPVPSTLPSINTWYDPESDEDNAADSDDESISEAQQLQNLIDEAEDEAVPRTRKQTQDLLGLTSATMALSADDMMKIHATPDNKGEILDELIAEEHGAIQAVTNLAPLVISETSKPLGRGSATAQTIDFDYLVELRRRHQTIQAARGVRTRVIDTTNTEKAKEASLRQQLIRKFHLALKEDQDRAVGTGVEREARWKASAPGGRGGNVPGSSSDIVLAGNSANAALTATALAKKAAAKRKEVFTKAKVPNLADVIGARVTVFRPLRVVFGMQSKGGGKHGKHEAVTDSSNVSALSKISVQVFEHLHGPQFRSIPTATALLQTKQFGHIAPINFLCLLSAVPKFSSAALELAPEDSDRFKTLSRGLSQFNTAMTLFRKRGKKVATPEGDSGEEEAE